MNDEDTGFYRCYVPTNFRAESMELIRQANIIILEYENKGFSITLRQLYYQFVARGLFANQPGNYSKLGGVISDGRLAGLVSWTAIEDRGRSMYDAPMWTDPRDAIQQRREEFRHDLWKDQPFRLVVGAEKDGMLGIIGGICDKLRVPFTSFHGYNSQSAMWRLGRSFARHYQGGQRPILLHLGDHDPDGIDMTRDNQERLSLFAGIEVTVVRLALNMEQVHRYGPPPNPVKPKSPRYADYSAKFGEQCWELDALSPEIIADLIEVNVAKFRDEAKWSAALALEAADKDQLDIILEGLA